MKKRCCLVRISTTVTCDIEMTEVEGEALRRPETSSDIKSRIRDWCSDINGDLHGAIDTYITYDNRTTRRCSTSASAHKIIHYSPAEEVQK